MDKKDFKSFAFVGDVIDFEDKVEFYIGNYFKIIRAKENPFQLSKEFYVSFFASHFPKINRYEVERVQVKKKDNCVESNFYELSEDNWKYTIIEHKSPMINDNVSLIFGLSKLDLTIIFNGTFDGAKTWNPIVAHNFYSDNSFSICPIKTISTTDINEIVKITNLVFSFEKIKEKHFYLNKALNDYVQLYLLSDKQTFKIIAYISIFECLLTTYSKNNFHDKSLNNQLKKKIGLINNQLEDKIQVNSFFKGPDTLTIENIFGKIYQYRNDIAHGNMSDFDNDLQLFKGKKSDVLFFLRCVLKRVLIFSLENPQLVSDLKKC